MVIFVLSDIVLTDIFITYDKLMDWYLTYVFDTKQEQCENDFVMHNTIMFVWEVITCIILFTTS